MKRILAVILVACMVFSLAACGGKKETEAPQTEAPATEAPETKGGEGGETAADAVSFDDTSLFEYVVPKGQEVGFNDYYKDFGIECDMTVRSKGSVQWVGEGEVPLQQPKEKYTIGYSAYYTMDEVSAMYLLGAQQAAEELGVELLINDADYNQDAQNQAIEQWIVQGVDAVILSPCDYYGIEQALNALEEAGIPVVTYDAPPCAGSVDTAVVYDAVQQGTYAAEILRDYLLEQKSDMKGTIYYGTLPFIHPNAVTREQGFMKVFEEYPDIVIKPLTGESPEDHYTAFEGILQADETIIGLWGLYSSATYGIMNVVKATGKEYPLTSVDNDRVILEGIYNGEVLGSVCTNAIEGSRLAMLLAVKLIEGEEVPGIVYQHNQKVMPDNVEELFPQYYNGLTLEEYMNGATN